MNPKAKVTATGTPWTNTNPWQFEGRLTSIVESDQARHKLLRSETCGMDSQQDGLPDAAQ